MQKARRQPTAPRSPRQPPTACKHVVSGSLSLPAQGCFSPVPHGTRPLSVTRESLALEGGPPSFTPDSRAGRYSGIPLPPHVVFAYRAVTVSGAPFQGTSTDFDAKRVWVLQPRPPRRSVWARPGSLAATTGISVDFSSSGYLDVSVPQVRLPCADDGARDAAGFPHSAIQGSMRVCRSPWLIAAYHGLHRLRVPRHPPLAFIRLTTYSVKQSTRDLYE